jgi:transcriptional regulator with XRE-family HTH domain
MVKTVSPIAASTWNRAIGRWLRSVRAEMGWTQAELARQLTGQLGTSISEGQVYLWERGERTIPAVVVAVLRNLAGVETVNRLWKPPKPRRDGDRDGENPAAALFVRRADRG